MHIEHDNGIVKLELNNQFYSEESVSEALQEFSEFIDGSYCLQQGLIKLSLKPKTSRINSETLALEFCNYVLGLMKNRLVV